MGDLTPQFGDPLLGIVCGMESERRALGSIASDPRVRVGISGARPERAASEATRLANAGCVALLSWGLAGGLAPGLKSGDPVTARRVLSEGAGPLALTPVPNTEDAKLCFGSEEVILTPEAKATLHQRSQAAFVDMETHRIAVIGAEAGLPVYALRAIADPAEHALPALAANVLDHAGRPRIGWVMAGLIRRPWELPALLQAKRDSDAALAGLSRAAEEHLPRLLDRLSEDPSKGRPTGWRPQSRR